MIRPKFLSNHTHYSPAYTDARINVTPGKARQLNYYGQIGVDDTQHVITGAVADFTDKTDSQCLSVILNQTKDNLCQSEINVKQVTADTGFSSGDALRYCELQKRDAYIPDHGQNKAGREGFVYNKEPDLYNSTRGNKAILPFRKIKTNSKGYKTIIYFLNSGENLSCLFMKSFLFSNWQILSFTCP